MTFALRQEERAQNKIIQRKIWKAWTGRFRESPLLMVRCHLHQICLALLLNVCASSVEEESLIFREQQRLIESMLVHRSAFWAQRVLFANPADVCMSPEEVHVARTTCLPSASCLEPPA
jgi:hypothetical protein